jgi:hypothetical protein
MVIAVAALKKIFLRGRCELEVCLGCEIFAASYTLNVRRDSFLTAD